MRIRLFSKKKEGNPRKRFPNQYYKTIWVDKNMYKAIQLVARIEEMSVKKAARMMLHAGFSSIMGKKLMQHIENKKLVKLLNLKQDRCPSNLVKEVRRICKEMGIDHKKSSRFRCIL